MKIIVGLIHHESNSFNPNLTTLKEFKLLKNKEIMKNEEVYLKSSLKGIIDTLKSKGIEIVPTLVAVPTAEGGLVAEKDYQKIRGLYLGEIKKQDDVDGVCLALHGSMTTENKLDVEGDLLEQTRKCFGSEIPIAVAFDMHGMISDQILKNIDALAAYRTAPHVDKYETGVRAAELLLNILVDKIDLKTEIVKLPILLSGEMSKTDKYPMSDLISELEKIDKEEGVYSSSYFLGFPWADVKFNNAAAVVVADNCNSAQKYALKLAEKFWNLKDKFEFIAPAYKFEEALEKAESETDNPIFIIDSGDNPGAGSTQDNLAVCKYLLEEKSPKNKVVYASINKAEVVDQAEKIGEGQKIEIEIVSREDKVLISGLVKKFNFYNGVRSVLIIIGNLYLVFSDQKLVMNDPKFLFELGLEINDFKIVMLKSGYLSPLYQLFAKKTILALTPGYTYQVFKNLDYKDISRPIYPLDEIENLEFKTVEI